jgi:hypothetical protein
MLTVAVVAVAAAACAGARSPMAPDGRASPDPVLSVRDGNPTPTMGDGGSVVGTSQDGAGCRAPAPDYGPDTRFATALGAPLPPADCPEACGPSSRPSFGSPNIDVALPYGACAAGTPACKTTARVPCACSATLGPVHGFVCSCEDGRWTCRIRSVGAAACMCDAAAGG